MSALLVYRDAPAAVGLRSLNNVYVSAGSVKRLQRKKRGLRGIAVPRWVWAFIISRSRRVETAGHLSGGYPARPGSGRASIVRLITMQTTAALASGDGQVGSEGTVVTSGAGEAVVGEATRVSRSIVAASKARQIVRPAMKRRAQAYPWRQCRSWECNVEGVMACGELVMQES